MTNTRGAAVQGVTRDSIEHWRSLGTERVNLSRGYFRLLMLYTRYCHQIPAILPFHTLARTVRSHEVISGWFLWRNSVRSASARAFSNAASTLSCRNSNATLPSASSTRLLTNSNLWRQRPCFPSPTVGKTVTTRSFRPTGSNQWHVSNRRTVTYIVAIAIGVMGLSYAAVPLYRIFCQVLYILITWRPKSEVVEACLRLY